MGLEEEREEEKEEEFVFASKGERLLLPDPT